MENTEYFRGLNYEGYYDEDGKIQIDINKKDAKEVLQRLTGAKVVIND